MKTVTEKEEMRLNKIIAFHQKEMSKMRQCGRMKDYSKHSTTLDLMYELRRSQPTN